MAKAMLVNGSASKYVLIEGLDKIHSSRSLWQVRQKIIHIFASCRLCSVLHPF